MLSRFSLKVFEATIIEVHIFSISSLLFGCFSRAKRIKAIMGLSFSLCKSLNKSYPINFYTKLLKLALRSYLLKMTCYRLDS